MIKLVFRNTGKKHITSTLHEKATVLETSLNVLILYIVIEIYSYNFRRGGDSDCKQTCYCL